MDGSRWSPSGWELPRERLVVAWGYGASSFFIDLRQGSGIEVEGDVSGFAGVEMEALESGEGALGASGGLWGDQVELGDFIAGERAGVSDVGFDGERVAGFQSSWSRASRRSRRQVV